MTLPERLDALVRLGDHLRGEDEYLRAVMHRAEYNNPWFTQENQEQAVRAIAHKMLGRDKLEQWLSAYQMKEPDPPQTVGLVMAGNIPLVGFHDLLCVFTAGHRAMIKLSEKDRFLLPYLLQLLERFDARTAEYFQIAGRLRDFDAVIATGSDNSARYFEAYFGKYPHIIRRNRSGVAVLTGRESRDELAALGRDVFSYFGLGCRNVAKLYLPRGYDFEPLMEALHEHRRIVLHNKYKNNFDYNIAMHILNKTPYRNNGCVILTENTALSSRIADLYFEFYDDPAGVEAELARRESEIQCIVAGEATLEGTNTIPFGQAQEPELWEYADGVDTMVFLLGLPFEREKGNDGPGRP